MRELALNCEQLLREGFRCTEIEVGEFMRSLDGTLHTFTTEYVRRLFRDINTNLLRKFNKHFKKDEQGKNREWRDIEEGPIRELWAKCKAALLEVIAEFKYIQLPKAALQDAYENLRIYKNFNLFRHHSRRR